jgi:hypothetical protein
MFDVRDRRKTSIRFSQSNRRPEPRPHRNAALAVEQEYRLAPPAARDQAVLVMPLRVIALPAALLSGRAVCQPHGLPWGGNECLKCKDNYGSRKICRSFNSSLRYIPWLARAL